MPPPVADAAVPSRMMHVLDTALDQSHGVKAEVEACADDVGSANDAAKASIAEGATTLPAAKALQDGLDVEERLQACAAELQQVSDNLAHGVEEIKAVEQALTRARLSLVESEDALALSRHAEHRASERAMHDQKTGLPNRSLFDDRLAQAIAGAERHGWVLAVMFLDLDRFKSVNDSHGHATGDAVLTAVAQRLLRNAREEDTVCRNGGDEFLYLLIDPSGREAVARIACMVRQAVGAPIGVGAQQITVTPSIGIAFYPEHGTDGNTLVEHADAAMYLAKQRGKPFEIYAPQTVSDATARRPGDCGAGPAPC